MRAISFESQTCQRYTRIHNETDFSTPSGKRMLLASGLEDSIELDGDEVEEI